MGGYLRIYLSINGVVASIFSAEAIFEQALMDRNLGGKGDWEV